MSDLGRAAAADGLDAGQGPQLLQHSGSLGFRQARQHRGDARLLARQRGGATVQLGLQLARLGEGALQPRAQRRDQVQAVDEGREQRHVAQDQGEVPAAASGGARPSQRSDLGVGGHGIPGLEGLDPQLQELLGPVRAARRDAERLALVAVAARPSPIGEMLPRHGHGEVRPQGRFLAAVAGDHEQPRTHGLAGQIEQQAQGLQHRRVGRHGAGGQQGSADGVERLRRNGTLEPHGISPR